ncbi:MAG: hypothetical protein O7F76_13475, partial [Planctomycetota bacterium]|nr:hypothetical protein [Planctomycetota bacterium]
DMPHLAIYLAALCIGIRAVRTARWPAAALCGFLSGAAFYLRQEALGIPMAVAGCLILFASGLSIRRRILLSLAVGAAFVAAVAPFAIATGTILHNKLNPEILFGMNGAHAQAATPVLAGQVTWWSAPWLMFTAWAASGTYVVSTWVFVALFWKRVSRGEPNARRLVFAAALLQCLAAQLRGSWLGVISDRYMLIPAALSIPWAAAGLRHLIDSYVLRRPLSVQRPPRYGLGIIIGLLVVLPMLYRCLRSAPPEAAFFRAAGAWLAENAQPGDRLVGSPRLDRMAFYADLPLIALDAPEPAAWFADHSDTRRLSDSELQSLAQLRRKVADLEPLAQWPGPGGKHVKLYRLP